LEYSSVVPGESVDSWGIDEAKKISKDIMTKKAVFNSYGCNQGEAGGLMEELHKLFKIKTVGSKIKTNYSPIGELKWKPKGDYVKYSD